MNTDNVRIIEALRSEAVNKLKQEMASGVIAPNMHVSPGTILALLSEIEQMREKLDRAEVVCSDLIALGDSLKMWEDKRELE